MMVMLPVLSHLATHLRHAHLTVVCERRNRAVLTMARFNGDVLTYDTMSPAFLLKLTRGHYDLVIDSEQFHHFSAIFSLLSHAPIRIGFNINPRRNPLYSHLVPYSPNQSELEQFMSLLHPLPIPRSSRGLQGSLDGVTGAIPGRLATLLYQNADSTLHQRYVAIHAGSSSPYKHWEESKFVDMCTILIRDMHIQPVLVGGPDDTIVARNITTALNSRGLNTLSVVGQLSLEETSLAIHHAAAFVGLDSGLAHIAVALNRPTVVLFGPTDPVKWGTDGGHHKVIYKAVPCSPCAIFGYFRPCSTFACMKLITTADVVNALKQVL